MFVQQRFSVDEQLTRQFNMDKCGATQVFCCATHNRLISAWSNSRLTKDSQCRTNNRAIFDRKNEKNLNRLYFSHYLEVKKKLGHKT